MRQAGLAQKRGIATQALLKQDLRGGFSVMRGNVPRQRRAQKTKPPVAAGGRQLGAVRF